MSNRDPGAVLVVAGGAMVAGAALLPWATLGILSVSGIQGPDGFIALVLGGLLVALGWSSLEQGPGRGGQLGALVLSVLSLGLYGLKISTVGASGEDDGAFRISAGSGLYVGALGALIAMFAWTRFSRPKLFPTTRTGWADDDERREGT